MNSQSLKRGAAHSVSFHYTDQNRNRKTGTANIVVWKKVYETFRKAVIAGRLVRVTGRIERDDVAVLVCDFVHASRSTPVSRRQSMPG